MICVRYNQRLHTQLERANEIYAKLIYKKLFTLNRVEGFSTKEHLRKASEIG